MESYDQQLSSAVRRAQFRCELAEIEDDEHGAASPYLEEEVPM